MSPAAQNGAKLPVEQLSILGKPARLFSSPRAEALGASSEARPSQPPWPVGIYEQTLQSELLKCVYEYAVVCQSYTRKQECYDDGAHVDEIFDPT